MTNKVNSTIAFRNTDADTGKVFMNVDITWGDVQPAFVNLLGDALIKTVVEVTMQARAMAEQASAQ